ncbi:MAG: hypothetical protein JO316_02910 [Abitibacteriaceae bacterium]|nr:hypothetical protein [Abditibacteriaceae bacterium]MBV9864280.1 hypothetical protein [Abditibacteriaceae bacterium]
MKLHELLGAALVLLSFCTILVMPLVAAPAAGPRLALVSPPQAVVDLAIKMPLTRHNRNIKGGAHTNMGHQGEAPVILAGAALAGNTSADARLLEQMRYTLTGGNDITANGGYPAQHDRHITAMFTLAKLTPRIWNQLSEEERHKADLLMTAAFVSCAFTTSDNNPYVLAHTQQYAVDGDDNLNRDWNPNFREGMVGGLLVGVVYFGGPDKAQAVLDGFNHAAFVTEVDKAGLSNIHETFTWKAAHPDSNAPAGSAIEQVVRNFRYKTMSLQDYMKIYAYLTDDTYGKTVNCGLNNGQGVQLPDGTHAGMLLTGCDELPNKGKPGMLKEFDSVDAGGPRSSTGYAYDGFRCNLVNHYVLVAGGYWQDGDLARECLAKMQVGSTDLWYKLDHGYSNYAKGHTQGEGHAKADDAGFQFTRALWEQVVLPYHKA